MDEGSEVKGRRIATRKAVERTPSVGTELVRRPGSCSTGVHEGREAVMPGSGLEIDLAECEFLGSSPDVGGDSNGP